MTDRALASTQWAVFVTTMAVSLAACSAPDAPEPATPTPVAQPAPETQVSAQTPAQVPQQSSAPPATQYPVPSTPTEPQPPAAKPSAPNQTGAEPEPTAIVITTLSKGRGVPAPARDAYKQIRGLLEEQQSQSAVTNIDTQRIGIEGEMRMCAEFRDRAQAEYTFEQIRKISTDVELLNVVEGPCPPTKRDKP